MAPVEFSNSMGSGENHPIPSRVTEQSAESDTKWLLIKYWNIKVMHLVIRVQMS